MQIRRFYLPELPPEADVVMLPPEEAVHAMRVLRLRGGDQMTVLDGRGTVAEACIEALGEGRRFVGASCRILSRRAWDPPVPAVRLYVAPPRGGAMGQIVRSAVELGVCRITPVLCRYGVSRPDGKAVAGWQQDAVAALKQSGNAFLPEIDPPQSFAAALSGAVEPGVFGAVPGSGAARAWPVGDRLGVWIGPEGGFAADEEGALWDRGFVPLTVGRWVLRVETAVPAILGAAAGRSCRC